MILKIGKIERYKFGGNMKNLEIKAGLLLMIKGVIQLLKIIVSFANPLLIAVYFYSLVTVIFDWLLTPELTINYQEIGALLILSPIVLIVFGVIIFIGRVVYKIVEIVSTLLQTGLSYLLLRIEVALSHESVFDTILDSKKLKYILMFVVELIAIWMLYHFFAKYDFNMNTFCFAIGGSATFGSLIELNEQFKMFCFYSTTIVMVIASLFFIKKNYVNSIIDENSVEYTSTY